MSKKAWDIYFDAGNNAPPEERLERSRDLFNKAVRISGKNSSAYEGLGRVLCSKNRHEEAIEYYNKALSISPRLSGALNGRANCKKDLGQLKSAMDDYFEASNLAPEDHFIYFNIGLMYYEQGNYEKSIKFNDFALEHNKDYGLAYYQRAKTYKAMGEYELARKDFEMSIKLDSTYTNAHYELGDMYQIQGLRAKAIQLNSEGIRISKDCGVCFYGRAYAKQDSGLYQEALLDYAVYRDKYPETFEVYVAMGNSYHSLKEKEKALEYYNKSISLNKESYYGYFNRGIYYKDLEQYPEAEQDLIMAIKADSTKAAAYDALGVVYANWNKYAKAIHYYKIATGLSPQNTQMRINMALAKRDSGLHKEAMLDFEMLKTMEGGHCTALQNIAWLYMQMKDYKKSLAYYDSSFISCDSAAYLFRERGFAFMKMKKYKEAISDYNYCIAKDSVYANGYNNRGMLYYELKEYNKAMKDFLTCIRLEPTGLYPYNNLANCYSNLGETEKACEYWKKALDMGYKYKAEWKEEYGIDDPVELVKKNCK